MMRVAKALARDDRGTSALQFALSAPVFVMMIWGMFQVSLVLQANAGVQNALGQAAREATIWPTPNDATLQAKITSSKFGVGNGTWSTPTISTLNTADNSRVITVSYTQPTNFLFFTGPDVTITKTKKIYLQFAV